jgi:hypothetical protein
MRIYVAGASKEIEIIEGFLARLRRAGYVITHDWTQDMREEALKGKTDVELTPEERARYAKLDLAGVESCEVFWLAVPANQSLGAWIELGFALALRAQSGVSPVLMVSGPASSIFTDLADFRFPTHEACLFQLCEALEDRATLTKALEDPSHGEGSHG